MLEFVLQNSYFIVTKMVLKLLQKWSTIIENYNAAIFETVVGSNVLSILWKLLFLILKFVLVD